MASAAEIELFERDAELGELRTCLEDVSRGAGRLVVLEGEAGIGKTGLVRAACTEAKRASLQVLSARGTELERDFPFAVVRQLFEPVLAAATPDQRAELLAGGARLAGPVVGVEEGDAGADSDAGLLDPTFTTLNALYWLTSNLSEAQPLLLAIDDAHWADPASLRFVEFLRPRLEDLPVLLVVAARPAEPGAEIELLARLSTDTAARVLRPRALTGAAVADVVCSMLSPQADEAFCAACHEATRGNPFILRELLVELRAEGSAGAADDVCLVREVAPSSIQRAVLLRLARLPDEARRLARAVAVLGDDSELPHAAELAGVDLADAAVAVDALAAAGIFETGARPRFVHPLVRNAIHADLPPSETIAAHDRAAQLLTVAGAEPERVALHLLATAPAGDDAVTETLSTAAQRALERAAPEAALRYLQRALAEPAGAAARPRILRQLITAGVRTGVTPPIGEAGEDPVAELTADAETVLASAWELSMFLLAAGRGDELLPLIDRAVALASERGDLDAALRLEALVVSTNVLSPAKARARCAHYAEAISPDTPGERLWLALQSWWGTFLGDSAASTAEMARAALANGRIFSEQVDLPPPGQAILVLTRTDHLDLAMERIDALAADASARGSATTLGQASYLRANVELLRGDVAQAAADARSAFETAHRGGYLAAVPIFAAVHLDALIERDELEAADAELAGLGWTGSLPRGYWWAALLLSRGRLRLAQSRFEEAAADLLEVGRANERAGVSNRFYHIGSLVAMALAGSGRDEEARHSAMKELERARSWGVPSAIGATLRVTGLLEAGDDGLARLREAISVLEPSPVRLEYMRALTDYGGALRRANRRTDARAPLREALELARRGGALAIAKRAHEELAATGETLRPLVATGVESLTPSERRVAGLAADGLTNREIAQSLFLTVKTVETHLSHAYRKLDIASRRELRKALDA